MPPGKTPGGPGSGGGERGVLGIAIDPQWPTEQQVYVYYTEANPERNRIVRLSKGAEPGLERRLLATIPATGFHDGGVLHFGPDGKLYAVTGDAGVPGRSQRVTNPAGKVLRMEEDGSRPGDNPFARGQAFSIGHRNSFGFAFDPQTGRLWQTENGPECDDEVNLVIPGRNYGWGRTSECPRISESGPQAGPAQASAQPTDRPHRRGLLPGLRAGSRDRWRPPDRVVPEAPESTTST